MARLNDSNSNMHYYIGVLKTINGQGHEAVQNFINAVEKSDDNYFHHFFWKGLALAVSGCYDLARSEFEVAKSIDKTNFKASLHIGTCYLILDDLNQAYEAFTTVVGDPHNEMEVNYCIGKFFMTRGFMNHAIQSFRFALKHFPTEKALQELVKCYISEKNLASALDGYEQLQALETRNKKLYQFDVTVLEAVKKCSEARPAEALSLLSKLEGPRKEGFIFKRLDLLLYTAITHFYHTEYQQAFKIFTLIELDFYAGDKGLPPEFEEDCFNMLFCPASEREGSQFISTKSITYPELIYNMAICQLMIGNIDKGFLKLCSLKVIHHIKGRIIKLLEKIRPFVSQEVLDREAAASSLDNYSSTNRAGKQLGATGEINSEQEEFCAFPAENRLCCIYPAAQVTLPDESKIEMLLSFCLPSIEVSEIQITVSYEELLKINLRSIENRPEAPWIKKIDEKVMFTNHVVDEEVEEYDSPSEVLRRLEKKNLPVNTMVRIHVQNAYEHNLEAMNKPHESPRENSNIDEEEFDEEDDGKPDLAKLKRELMLDDRTNQVLNNLKK